ncbi:cytochrome C oxidase subunit IV family protein [Marinoscillum sp. 108]|jgi:cytochrome c oxidase subunit IV|uniref:Cytochrome C oxidase subunit IV family protein n=1 Tax=Marinoscillum luteum TaxID=861051 RepID=A0ABW7N4Q7_9BACT|nr:cytochrome C oxidase subunit IV family protein [Marinoscillum sp. 108]VXD12193.1 Cytochrome c oxidase subunit IV [Marinoscillum sp. 108]
MELETTEVQVIPEDKSKINKILKVALILGVVTAIEFVIAFTVPAGVFRTSVFIILTIVKAFYIVAEFMHLGHEKKSLKLSILLPIIFIVFLIFILMYQGAAILEVLQ